MMDTMNILLTILKIIAEVIALIITLFGLSKWFRVKFEEKQKLQEEKQKEQDKKFDEIRKDLKDVKKEISSLSSYQRINEIDRIKQLILDFGEKLRVNKDYDNFYNLTLESFKLVFEQYQKYKELGGNGYIDAEMEFIRDEFHNMHY